MSSTDARCLSQNAQEALRFRVIEALGRGMKPAVAARTFGVSRSSVWSWWDRIGLGNVRSLESKRWGRPRRSRLPGQQAGTVVRMISERCPDHLKLSFALWTGAAVQQLLAERFDVHMSQRTVGGYLVDWGLMPQQARRRAYERDRRGVKRWLNQEYAGARR